jgi:hypothetical protein
VRRSWPTTTLTRAGSGVTVELAAGGHPAPLLVRADGTTSFADIAHGQLVGVLRDPLFTRAMILLRPGDDLLLYTDGITEARVPAGVGAIRATRDDTSCFSATPRGGAATRSRSTGAPMQRKLMLTLLRQHLGLFAASLLAHQHFEVDDHPRPAEVRRRAITLHDQRVTFLEAGTSSGGPP